MKDRFVCGPLPIMRYDEMNDLLPVSLFCLMFIIILDAAVPAVVAVLEHCRFLMHLPVVIKINFSPLIIKFIFDWLDRLQIPCHLSSILDLIQNENLLLK